MGAYDLNPNDRWDDGTAIRAGNMIVNEETQSNAKGAKREKDLEDAKQQNSSEVKLSRDELYLINFIRTEERPIPSDGYKVVEILLDWRDQMYKKAYKALGIED